jgi:hypothetical protein
MEQLRLPLEERPKAARLQFREAATEAQPDQIIQLSPDTFEITSAPWRFSH